MMQSGVGVENSRGLSTRVAATRCLYCGVTAELNCDRRSSSILPIFPKEQFRQATQSDRADQNAHTDYVPAIRTKRNDADTVQESGNRHYQKERPGEVAVHPPAPSRIGDARGPHYAQRENPSRCSPSSTNIVVPGRHNRDNGKAKQSKRQQPIRKNVARPTGCCVTLHEAAPPNLQSAFAISSTLVRKGS